MREKFEFECGDRVPAARSRPRAKNRGGRLAGRGRLESGQIRAAIVRDQFAGMKTFSTFHEVRPSVFIRAHPWLRCLGLSRARPPISWQFPPALNLPFVDTRAAGTLASFMSRLPFELLLALRYLRPKRTFVSIITLISVLGVTLGVAVLIIVISVMSGFDRQLREKILGFNAHIRIAQVTTPAARSTAELRPGRRPREFQSKRCLSAAPFAMGRVMLETEPECRPAVKSKAPSSAASTPPAPTPASPHQHQHPPRPAPTTSPATASSSASISPADLGPGCRRPRGHLFAGNAADMENGGTNGLQ